jgi:hypothetical protein
MKPKETMRDLLAAIRKTEAIQESPRDDRVHDQVLARMFGNQRIIMRGLYAILDKLDDRKQRIIAALDKEYGGLFTPEEKAHLLATARIEDIILVYMRTLADVTYQDAEANLLREAAVAGANESASTTPENPP